MQINNSAELVCNGGGTSLFLASTAANQFLQFREMQLGCFLGRGVLIKNISVHCHGNQSFNHDDDGVPELLQSHYY